MYLLLAALTAVLGMYLYPGSIGDVPFSELTLNMLLRSVGSALCCVGALFLVLRSIEKDPPWLWRVVLVVLTMLLGAGVIYWLDWQNNLLEKAITVLLVLSALSAILAAFWAISRRSLLTRSEVATYMALFSFLAPITAMFVWFFAKWALEASQPLILLGIAPLAALWVLLVKKFLELRRSREAISTAENAEA